MILLVLLLCLQELVIQILSLINQYVILKNIIFKIGDVETQIQQMERSGFDRDSTFTFVAIMLEEEKSYHQGEKMDKIARSAEEAGRNIQDTYLSFHHKGALVVVLVDYKKEKIDQFIHDFSSLAAWRLGEDSKKLKLGISQNIQGISKQEENLSKAIAAMFISGKEHKVLYYDALDIYKLLVSIKDRNVLKECYQEIIGKLRQYDKENETESEVVYDSSEIENNFLERVALKSGQKIHVILVPDIVYIQSDGDYVQLFTEKGKFIKENTMKYFEANLHPKKFVRIHRSYIVNVEKITRIELYEKNSQMLILKNGHQVKASTAGYKMLREVLNL